MGKTLDEINEENRLEQLPFKNLEEKIMKKIDQIKNNVDANRQQINANLEAIGELFSKSIAINRKIIIIKKEIFDEIFNLINNFESYTDNHIRIKCDLIYPELKKSLKNWKDKYE